MSGAGGPGVEQGRRLLLWVEANYKKLAVALGGVWLVAAGAAAFKASSGTLPRPDALPTGQQQQQHQQQQGTAEALGQLLQQQEAAAREQMRREARWEQEERQEADIRRDEEADGWAPPRGRR